MRLWEVIKELSENSNKKFEVIGRKHLNCYVKKDSTFIQFENTSIECGFRPEIHEDWQEVKQPVTWKEAIQAWLDGKRVYVELKDGEPWTKFDIERTFFFVPADLKNTLTDGKWYIE